MPNLVTQAQRISELEDQLSNVNQTRGNFDRLKARSEQLQSIRSNLVDLSTQLQLMSESKINSTNVPSASKALKKKSQSVISDFSGNWVDFVNSKSIKPQFIDPLESHIEKMKKALSKNWSLYIGEQKPKISSSSLEPLKAAGFSENVSKIQDLLSELDKKASHPPETKADIDRVIEISTIIPELFSELEDIPQEVLSFLKKAAIGRAPLLDLTNDVKSWLQDHNMLDQLHVGLG
jgi:hypothetical protein